MPPRRRVSRTVEGHVARKRYGQNFLADPHYVTRIADAVAPKPGERVVEIGPGLGALTGELVARAGRIVAMYHDQGLPVLKAASFGLGVNVTLGLPFPRTSVDHGTALDLAVDAVRAKTADPGSLFAAVDLAVTLAR